MVSLIRPLPILLMLALAMPGAHAAKPAAAGSLNAETAKLGFTLGAAGNLAVDQVQEKKGEKLRFVSLRALDGDRRIEIEATSPLEAEESEAMARQRLQIIAKQYGAQKTPYPGELTNIAVCREKHKPALRTKRLGGLSVSMLVGFASSRYSFGACDKDTIRNLGLIGYFFLPESKALVEVRAFRPYPGTSKESLFSLLDGLAQPGAASGGKATK